MARHNVSDTLVQVLMILMLKWLLLIKFMYTMNDVIFLLSVFLSIGRHLGRKVYSIFSCLKFKLKDSFKDYSTR